MTRVWRLRPRGEFERIRQNGRSWPHRFFVLIVLPQTDRPAAPPRIGIAAGKKLGGAVTRNRYKRVLREAVRQVYANIPAGVDVVLIARAPIAEASVAQVESALSETLRRAGAWRDNVHLEAA
ncbi:MAG TPA: ribonuclease P protein component [Anaerolineae bacterium]|nr:ribonuclease P protein component [Anaerolineae bacterium]